METHELDSVLQGVTQMWRELCIFISYNDYSTACLIDSLERCYLYIWQTFPCKIW